MKKALFFLCFVLILVGLVSTATAANMTFRYRDSAGNEVAINSMADLNAQLGPDGVLDPNAYRTLKQYLTDVNQIKARIKHFYNDDITVTVASDGSGSASGGQSVTINSDDWNRAVSTLAHETGHSYMRENYGGYPPWNYGKDGNHYVNEITTEQTAWLEGYAEWCGSHWGMGQERVECAGSGELEKIKREGPNFIGADGNTYFNYLPTDWKDIGSADDMWRCEGINALILKDFTHHVPNGTIKMQRLMKEGNDMTLKDFIKRWRDKYPEDRERKARIIDIDTNFTMDPADLKALTGADDYVDNQRAGDRAKYEDKDTCESLKDTFTNRPPGTGGGPGGGGPGTGLPAPGGGPGPGTGPTPDLDKFR